MFNLSPQPMWVYDVASLRFVQVNEAAIELYGYEQSEFLNMLLTDIITKQEISRLKTPGGAPEQAGGAFSNGRYTHLKKNGEEIKVDVYSSPITINNIPCRAVICIDVTEKILMEQEIRYQKEVEQREITKAVVKAQEKERAAIGEELHDNVNQLLAVSKLYISHGLANENSSRQDILKSQEYIVTAMDEIRKLSHVLVGPTENKTVGLIEPIEELINSISVLNDIKFDFQHDNYNEAESDVGLRLVIYRIIQEQISNILKHAQASEVGIEIARDEEFLLVTISDNGKGFEPVAKSSGIGLTNIRNRAALYNGVLHIVSAPGKGCKMKIIFPEERS